MYPGIAQVAFQRILADITIAAKELQSLVADPVAHIGGKALGHGAPGALVRTAPIQLVGSLAHHQAGGGQFGGHVGQTKLHALKFADRTPELLALLDIGQCVIEGLLGGTHRTGGDIDAPAIEGLHGEPEAFPLLAQPVAGGDAHAVKGHLTGRLAVPAHLLLRLAITYPGRVSRHHKGGDPPCPLAAGARHYHQHIRAARPRDKHLAAVEEVFFPIAHGAGLEGRGIGARPRLGETIRAQQLAAGEPGYPRLGDIGW